MFRRRAKRKPHQVLLHVVWPRTGVRRAVRYLGHRLARLPGTPNSIAGGMAFGVAVSFTPLIGLHILLAVGLAWAARFNVVAAVIGTAVGNPWTFPLIWLLTYRVGAWLIGAGHGGEPPPDLSSQMLIDRPWRLLMPMLAGSAPISILAWLAFFWPGRYLVTVYQKNRRRRMSARRHFGPLREKGTER